MPNGSARALTAWASAVSEVKLAVGIAAGRPSLSSEFELAPVTNVRGVLKKCCARPGASALSRRRAGRSITHPWGASSDGPPACASPANSLNSKLPGPVWGPSLGVAPNPVGGSQAKCAYVVGA